MIKLLYPLPDDRKFFMAVSGGVDSMCAMHWLSKGKRTPFAIIHINHNTGSHACEAADFVRNYAQDHKIDYHEYTVKGSPPKGTSKEAWWREQRYSLFQSLIADTKMNIPIVLAHNLDDCVEQYILSTMIRIKENKIIPYFGPCGTIRPFRTWKKSEIRAYAKRNEVPHIEDPTNDNTVFTRNYVRKNILPNIALLNPGIYRHVKTLLEDAVSLDKI